MNINGGDKRNEFWKRGPDSIHDNHNSNITWNMLQYIIAGPPNTRSCWISISWCPELANLPLLADQFIASTLALFLCTNHSSLSVRLKIPIYPLMKSSNKNEIPHQNFVHLLISFWSRRVPSRLLQQEVLAPRRSCSETSRLDCCRREADCYHILPRNAGVTYANPAISHPSERRAWSRLDWDKSMSIQLLGLQGATLYHQIFLIFHPFVSYELLQDAAVFRY